jgi:hypothetical protein
LAVDDHDNKARLEAFQQRLQQLGWTEGHDLRIDYRFTAGHAHTVAWRSPLERSVLGEKRNVANALRAMPCIRGLFLAAAACTQRQQTAAFPGPPGPVMIRGRVRAGVARTRKDGACLGRKFIEDTEVGGRKV